jgi:hypothetical protein
MRRIMILAAAALAVAGPVTGQGGERSLHWAEWRVEARLDSAGQLHIREHQGMVFHGDWNGGEREVDARLGQRVRLGGLWRVEPATGSLQPLVEDDDLEEIDQYDRDGNGLRWRSRLPGDPLFAGERMDYVLEYVITNAVVPSDDGYLLDHDFLPPDRAGVVERFHLDLSLDDVWRPLQQFSGRQQAESIPPGRGFAVHLPLRYEAAGAPESVLAAPPPAQRWLLLVGLLAGSLVLLATFYRRERDAGRHDPLPEVVHEEWLREHVLVHSPELVGAAWDRTTGAAEVAALTARLVQEGKLASRVEVDPASGSGDAILHLELRAPRDAFDSYERPLIDALFFDDRERTDTQTIKDHYEKTGFDPASKIAPALGERVDALGGVGVERRPWKGVWIGLAVGATLWVAALIARPTDLLAGVMGFVYLATLGGIGVGIAATYATRVTGLRGLLAGVVITLTLLLGGLAIFVGGALETTAAGPGGLSPFYRPGLLLLTALTVLALATVAAVLTVARPTDTPARLALRRKLAAAESYFRKELDRPDPALHDEWFPYLLAFGLGRHIDRWFDAYGPASDGGATAAALTTAATVGSGGAGTGTSTWTGGGATFGGGGGFSGGGVGGSWGAAAGAIASGVSPPSSSGGTSGGASSGGGSAGGW